MQNKKEEKINLSDDSDDEYIESRIGNVPREWYSKEGHFGYTSKGKKVQKVPEGTQIDKLIKSEENPEFWRYIFDELNNQTVYLTDQQLQVLKRIKERTIVDDTIRETDYSYEIPQDPFPMSYEPVIKRRFLPSKHEQQRINKIIRAIRNGWIKIKEPEPKRDPIDEFLNNVGDVWISNKSKTSGLPSLPPPKANLPSHEESFNPAPELFDHSIPPVFNLRGLASSDKLVKEQFERLLTLYLAPRIRKKKIHMKKEDLLDELPNIEDLKPFPTKCVLKISNGLSSSTCSSVSPDDLFIVSGDESGSVTIMHIMTSKIICKFSAAGPVIGLKFISRSSILVVSDKAAEIYGVKLNLNEFNEAIESYKSIYESHGSFSSSENGNKAGDSKIAFSFPAFEKVNEAPIQKNQILVFLMKITIPRNRIINYDLHAKKEYLVLTTAKSDDTRQIDVISIPKCKHTVISIKAKSKIQKTSFHNKKPLLFIMTVTHVFIFDLQKQAVKKKLITGCRLLSDLAIHNTGDHVLVASQDKRLLWFDLDSNEYPYKKMKVHNNVITKCAFNRSYDLFASASDDGRIVIQHAHVDEEGFGYPTIVPLKVLISSSKSKHAQIIDLSFYNKKYFAVSTIDDGTIHIWA
jgi:ribosome biogenesis protein ERB1